jgi:hypothetical protein
MGLIAFGEMERPWKLGRFRDMWSRNRVLGRRSLQIVPFRWHGRLLDRICLTLTSIVNSYTRLRRPIVDGSPHSAEKAADLLIRSPSRATELYDNTLNFWTFNPSSR